MNKVTVVKYTKYPTYYIDDIGVVVKISELPEDMQKPITKFMHGQTMPLIDGHTDLIYMRDFVNFLHGGKLFWD